MRKLFIVICLTSWVLISYSQPWLRTLPQASTEYRDPRPATLQDLKSAFDTYWGERHISENETENASQGGHQQFARYEYMMRPRTYPTGQLFDQDILLNEYRQALAGQAMMKTAPAANWSYIGQDVNPANNGGTGRINVVRTHPTDPLIVFAGAACGGLWKSLDGGFTWSTTTDLLPSIAIADIAIDPQQPNTMYIATGDGYGYEVGGDFWGGIYTGGIFKSTDGGDTWASTGPDLNQLNKQIFNRLIINPQNPAVLLACSRSFIYRSDDGGQNWVRVLAGRVYDLEFKPGSPSIVYAGLSNALYKSTDGGLTFASFATFSGASGRMSVAVTPANPNVVYVLSESGDLWKSSDEGQTFAVKTSPAIFSTFYGYYDNVLEVSPADENVVLTGGVDIVRTNDGGQSWYDNNGSGSTGVHVDQKNFEFAANSSSTYIAVNDGGIYKTYNGGNTWVNLGDDIKIKQYYRMSSGQSNPSLYYAGAQDNGTDQYTGSFWRRVYGGDGMACAVNPSNANLAFVSSQYGNFRRTTDGGNNFSATGPSGQSGAWVTPIAIDPVVHSTVYIGYQSLYRSTNSGAAWTSISSNVFGGDDFDRIRIAPSSTSVIYASTLSAIKRSINGGFTFTTISTGLPLGALALTDIAISSSNADHAWASFSGYSADNKVYRTVDGGSNWSKVTSEGLPNLPVNCIIYQPGSNDMVYAGTDIGMYYKDNTMPRWMPFNDGLPNVMIADLEILPGINKIRAATYGRGIWESDLAPSSFHALDAGLVAFSSLPGLSCSQQVTPEVQVENFGSTAITSLNIHYRVDAGTVQTFAWNGNLASLATVNVALPQQSLADGMHTIEAFVSDPNGSADPNPVNDSIFGSLTIISSAVTAPVQEGFETGFPPLDFRIDDPSGMLTHSNAAGGWGLSAWSLRAGFYDSPSGMASMTSLPVDMTTLSLPQLTFDVAYKRTVPTIRDSLIVEVSDDCGATWNMLYAKFGSSLFTAGGYGYQPFVPASGEWRNELISLSAYAAATQLLIRFSFVSKYGNYLYVDNINLDDPTGIDESTQARASVFPVPASDVLHVRLESVPGGGRIVVELTDVAGRLVMNELIQTTNGRFSISLPANTGNGYYHLRLRSGNDFVVNKPVVVTGR